MREYDKNAAPTDQQVEKYNYLSPMLDAALNELREFSKKKQDGIISDTKIKIVNRLLRNLAEVLVGEPSAGYLDTLSEEEVTQNSDAVLIVGQYRAALDTFESSHTRRIDHRKTWITKEWIAEEEERQRELEEEEWEEEEEE